MIGGRIGIAVILKIGDISGIRPGLCRDKAFGLGKLFRNRERGGGGEFTASAAKDAAACVERPVAVRTGASGGKRQLIDLAAECLAQIRVQGALIHMSSK